MARDGGFTQRVPAGHARRQLADRLALARAQQTRGHLTAALDTLAQILDAGQDLGGATVRTAWRMLAEIHLDLGHTGYAHQLAADLFADCTRVLGPSHPATIRGGALLAATAHHVGDLDAAEELCHRVLAAAPPDAAPARRAVLLARVRLALIAVDRHDLGGAVPQLAEVFGRFRDRYGDDDPDALRIAGRLGALYETIGDRPAARRVLTRAHHAAAARLGPAHPVTARLEAQLTGVEPPMPTAPEELVGSGRLRGLRLCRRGRSRPATPTVEPVTADRVHIPRQPTVATAGSRADLTAPNPPALELPHRPELAAPSVSGDALPPRPELPQPGAAVLAVSHRPEPSRPEPSRPGPAATASWPDAEQFPSVELAPDEKSSAVPESSAAPESPVAPGSGSVVEPVVAVEPLPVPASGGLPYLDEDDPVGLPEAAVWTLPSSVWTEWDRPLSSATAAPDPIRQESDGEPDWAESGRSVDDTAELPALTILRELNPDLAEQPSGTADEPSGSADRDTDRPRAARRSKQPRNPPPELERAPLPLADPDGWIQPIPGLYFSATHEHPVARAKPRPSRRTGRPPRSQRSTGAPVPAAAAPVRAPSRTPGKVPTVARRRHAALPLWGLLAVAVLGAGLVVDLHAGNSRDTGSTALVTAAPGSVRPTGQVTAQDVTVRPGATPDVLIVSWRDPSGGTAIPIVALSTGSGEAVVVATLRPGTTFFTRSGLDPATDYCAAVALYTGPAEPGVVGTRACLHRN